MGFLAMTFALDVIVSTLCMYIATKLAFVKAEIKPLILIIFIVSIIALIPTVGWILSFIAFIYLLMKATDADVIDCLWVVAFIKVITFFVVVIFISVFI